MFIFLIEIQKDRFSSFDLRAVSLGEKEAYAVVGARPSRACRVRLSDQWMEQIKDDEGRKKLADEVTGQMNFGSNMRGKCLTVNSYQR